MSFGSITRRRFVGCVAGAAAVVGAVRAAGVVVPAEWPVAGAPARAGAAETVGAHAGAVDLTFFDPRFARARTLALELTNGGVLTPVTGDPTDLLLRLEPLVPVRGVTVESFPFCIRQLHPRAALTVHRIDRDLFAWEIQRWPN